MRLHAWGVRRVFGYPGDGIGGLMAALNRTEGAIDFVQVRHEEMAALMACATAKFAGEVGVCLATSGPGAVHLLTASIHRGATWPAQVAFVPACEGRLAWLGRRRVWAGSLIGKVCGLIGTGSGQGRVRPGGHVTRRGIRPRTTRRMAWWGQAVGRGSRIL